MASTQYLTDEEIPDYCDLLPVTKSQVVFASGIIDSFVGRVNGGSKFKAFTATETVRPNRRGVVKLTHTPVISVDKVALQVPNAFRLRRMWKFLPTNYIVMNLVTFKSQICMKCL